MVTIIRGDSIASGSTFDMLGRLGTDKGWGRDKGVGVTRSLQQGIGNLLIAGANSVCIRL